MSSEPSSWMARVRDAAGDDLAHDLHTSHQRLNMGPSHPATHGTVKFLISSTEAVDETGKND